jgi:acyl-coenzyme A thioesterase PaaI-like protein
VVQGGIVAVMLEMAMVVACGGAISTASLNYHILRPVRDKDSW